jgi:hypothetical protein
MAQPEKVFRQGSCSASIFANEITRNGKSIAVPKVSFQKRYKDKSGEWKTSSSLDVNDLPKAVICLSKAYDYLTSRDESE